MNGRGGRAPLTGPEGRWPTYRRSPDISINQLITTARAEKMSALMTVDYLAERAARGDRSAFEQALAKVRAVEPDEDDA